MLDTSAPRTVLVVDDAPENLTLLGEILRPHYRVKVARGGGQALRAAAQPPAPDLVLLDIMMPQMDGYEVLARLRESPVTRDTPVIFVTAMDSSEDETHGLALGAADYIHKPARPAVVLARVRAQLQAKQARELLADQNSWLEHEVERRMQQNEMIQDVTLRALASLAEMRDNETGAHILRTQHYVGALAEDLAAREPGTAELSAERIRLITRAAPLHDLGKVGIPDAILHKPGPLDPDEWRIMQTHAALGGASIRRVIEKERDQEGLAFLAVAAEIAHYHHERWDGSGYPDGLAGNSIPLSARLMALADVFDALVNRRVYKAAMPVDEAAQIIRDGSGSHFDPQVAAAFERQLGRFRDILERFREPADTPAAP